MQQIDRELIKTMKKCSYRRLFVWFVVGMSFSALIQAETRYVSDEIEATLRTGPSLSHAIQRMLKSGVALEILEVNAENGYSRVKTSGGTEGWILSRYLMADPPARSQVEKIAKQITDAPDGSVRVQLTAIKDQFEKTSQRVAFLENENKRLEEQLGSIKKTSANILQIDEENKKLHQKLATTEERLTTLQLENHELGDKSQKDWFITGALVLSGGIVLGLILPLFTRKRRSRYDSF